MELTAGEVMHSPILTIAAETDIGEAAGMMARVDVRHLAVVRGGALVGLLSDYHVARLLPDLVAQRHE
jgi:CBS domain-containing protein